MLYEEAPHKFKMKRNPGKNRIILISIYCFVYLLLTTFFYHIDKYLTGTSFFILTILIPIVFIVIAIYFIKGAIQIIKHKQALTISSCFPTIISFITLTYTLFSPYRLDSENLESKIILKACFKGTQNQATLKFRADKTFELNWTGVFGADSWFIGSYLISGDTLYLKYTSEKPLRFGDTIVNNGTSLMSINKYKINSTQNFVQFYIGQCR